MKHKDLISKMTLKQKASLMSGKDFWQTNNIDELKIPSIFLADGPHGLRKQAAAADHLGLNASIPATCFPTAAAAANSWNPLIVEMIGEMIGEEALAQKVNVLLGPGTNIKRNPLCGRNFEYFSEDPLLAGRMASALIRGVQSNGISACVKHFAANNQEYRRMVIDTIVDERALREIYLMPFELAVKEGKTKTIMTSYNRLNGTFTNENSHLMRDILRDAWNYKGVAVTDWGGSNDRIKGLVCGNELEMPGNGGETNDDIVWAIKEGLLDEATLDENVDRLLDLIITTEKAFTNGLKTFNVSEHHAAAQKAAEESIVLLKNENILPLKLGTSVALIGDFARKPRYQGAGSSIVNPTKLDSTLVLIDDSGLNSVGFAVGYKRFGGRSKGLINKAVKLAKQSDIALLYLGLDEMSEVEGLDRPHMQLPSNQIELLRAVKATGVKTVVVLSGGAAVETDWLDDADALVYACLSGQAGAQAVLDVLRGKVNPSGKLAETFPNKYEDCSSAPYFPGKQVSVEYRESLFVGYRYYDTAGIGVRFPFGFGLSYTQFEYSNIKIEKDKVSFTITNTGKFAGAEVSQLYIGKKDSALFRARKELKGFCKTYIEAGGSETVTIEFDEYSFRYFDIATNDWQIEGGEYEVMIGASSEDIRLNGMIDVVGTKARSLENELPSYYSGNVQGINDEEFERLLGYKPPDPNYQFIKRKRVIVDENTTVEQLRYARGWTGRFFSGVIRFLIGLLKLVGNRDMSNMLVMGVLNQPMRGISRMTGGALCWGQLQGLMTMFNGKFFKGVGEFFRAGKERKRYLKELKKRGER